MPLTVIGVGGRGSGDDAVGLELVERLAGRLVLDGLSFLLRPDADPLTLAQDLLELTAPVLIVDCADMGLQPGESRCFPAESASLRIRTDSTSTHGLGVAEAIAIADALGFDRPVTLFGVQPFDTSPDLRLSLPMETRLPRLLAALESEVLARVGAA